MCVCNGIIKTNGSMLVPTCQKEKHYVVGHVRQTFIGLQYGIIRTLNCDLEVHHTRL